LHVSRLSRSPNERSDERDPDQDEGNSRPTAGNRGGALLVLEHPTWKVALLLVLGSWDFCRLHYFAFYVIEKYVDPGYKFSGL